METNISQLKCGECSEETHLIYIRENGEIITECIKCKSMSEITCTEPKITINNLNGNGTLCIFD